MILALGLMARVQHITLTFGCEPVECQVLTNAVVNITVATWKIFHWLAAHSCALLISTVKSNS